MFFAVFCAHKDCICPTSFVDRTLDDENRDLYGAIVIGEMQVDGK